MYIKFLKHLINIYSNEIKNIVLIQQYCSYEKFFEYEMQYPNLKSIKYKLGKSLNIALLLLWSEYENNLLRKSTDIQIV